MVSHKLVQTDWFVASSDLKRLQKTNSDFTEDGTC